MAVNPDEFMFDYVLARSRARETSILAVATIASTASIVLLGVVLQCNCSLSDNLGVTILGISFAIFGILYREVTARTIHQNDENWLNTFIRRLRIQCPNTLGQQIIGTRDDHSCSHIQDPLCYCKLSRTREALIRSLFVTPIIAWIWMYSVDQYCIGVVSIIISGLYASGIITCDIKKKHD